MNKLIAFLILSLVFTKNTAAQQDTALENRLNEVLKFTKVMNIEKVLDYTYPKLFSIATREQIKEAMLSSFETDEFSSTMDRGERGRRSARCGHRRRGGRRWRRPR